MALFQTKYRPRLSLLAFFFFKVILTDTDRYNDGEEIISPFYVEFHVYPLSHLFEKNVSLARKMSLNSEGRNVLNM